MEKRALLICGVLGALALWVAPGTGAAVATPPSCAEGPQVSGVAIVGTPCADRIGLGRHVVGVAAIDPAGNIDRSPALFAFQVKARRPGKPARSSG